MDLYDPSSLLSMEICFSTCFRFCEKEQPATSADFWLQRVCAAARLLPAASVQIFFPPIVSDISESNHHDNKMSPRPEYMHLHRILHDSLHRFSDLSTSTFTQEIEKDLLISLSQVFRQVKQLVDELDSDEMFLLTINSRYAQHLVGNTLVAISEFLLASDGDWDEFMQLLCLCLDLAIRGILKSSPDSAFETRHLDFNPSIKSLLELKLKNTNCSLEVEAEVDFSSMIWQIVNLVPKLTLWCQVEVQSPHHVRMSHYFRHKVLMLMVRVSSIVRIGPTISKTWIHLLHDYFEDLLLQPMSGGKLDQDGFLEGSPFCTSIFDEKQHNIPSFHLQRLVILLFFKCSLNLVGVEAGPDEQECMDENLKHISSSDLNLELEFCCTSDNSIGLTELHKWLQLHVHADILLNDELYFERCVRFTLSFIQLFMHEDDILFKMLLQLFHVPSFFQERQIINDEPLAEVKNCLAADVFNPIHLFHLFLAEISYDHQVLLDHLISKDTGSICAEYLLSLFVEFPGVKDDSGESCVKRRKILADSRDIKFDEVSGALFSAIVDPNCYITESLSHKHRYFNFK
ncbi:hypothetical protein SASPL_139952 [Salvia splendens]|uniref:Protein Lines N-terminal domain-containing protein n=1 Tax=Salvia splendens TaxID=180675 RepID=A0A8X8WMZ8_SALSN|nr:hypothetical protein SASPL_139952 [Salvia splendens]